jgi:hypothetical protein
VVTELKQQYYLYQSKLKVSTTGKTQPQLYSGLCEIRHLTHRTRIGRSFAASQLAVFMKEPKQAHTKAMKYALSFQIILIFNNLFNIFIFTRGVWWCL